jgi:coenzyme PQQ synthesis protein D (PqqD)
MYKVSNGVRSTQNQDGMIVLDIERGRMLRLNVTGSLIFERLQQGQTESQIIEGISQEFHLSRDITQTDVGEFLKSMEQAGLVRNETPQVSP